MLAILIGVYFKTLLFVVCLYAGILSHSGDHHLFACSLEFRRTLKIIARILREVVNRVKLCGHHTVRCSHVEVQSHVVVRRRGKVETRMSLSHEARSYLVRAWMLGCPSTFLHIFSSMTKMNIYLMFI